MHKELQKEVQKENRSLKPFVLGAFIFTILGVTVAYQTLSRFGLESNYVVIFSVALLVAALMLNKNIWMMGLVLLGVLVVNLPDPVLLQLHIDQDIMLASVCAIILVPAIYDLMMR